MKFATLFVPAVLACAFGLAAATPSSAQDAGKIFKVGMVGIDTSHAKAFASILNTEENKMPARVVGAVAQNSPDIPSSVERMPGFVEELKTKWGVAFYDSIEAMLPNVDVVMIESVDGRPHLAQARPAIEAGKPVFIDKPMAASLRDVIAIFDLAEKHHVPVWSSSNLRFHAGVVKAATTDVGGITMALSFGPASLEEHHPDLMWYGIHPVEALFTVMGTGCKTVSRVHEPGTDLVTGHWEDGKIGAVLGIREGKGAYGVKVFGKKQIIEESAGGAYPELMAAMMEYFKTGKPPVDAATTIEIFAFMEAADESKRRGGAPVSIAETIEKARAAR